MTTTLVRRIAKLKNTASRRTFPRELGCVARWPHKTAMFFGMNHDFIRTCILLRLIDALEVDAFVETGTHVGRTCFLIASQTNLPVFSSEVNSHYRTVARWFLKCFGSRIHLSSLDSVTFLRNLLGHMQFRRPLFYLDAHWYRDLPLVEEIRTIANSVESFLAVIDDFKVPADDGFGFDRYGDMVLDWALIERELIDSGRTMAVYFPAYPSSIEVGDRRGWVVIATLDNEKLVNETVTSGLLKCHVRVGNRTQIMSVQPEP